MLGWQPAQDHGDFEKGKRYLLIDKAKDGIAKRYVELEWDDHSATFRETRDPDEPPDYIADCSAAAEAEPLDGGESF